MIQFPQWLDQELRPMRLDMFKSWERTLLVISLFAASVLSILCGSLIFLYSQKNTPEQTSQLSVATTTSQSHILSGVDSVFATFLGVDLASLIQFDGNDGYVYGKDKNHAYWSNELDWGIIESADSSTFSTSETIYPFAKDSSHVFFLDKIVAGADPNTFEAIPLSWYAKDKEHVFSYTNYCELRNEFEVRGADPETFQVFTRDSYYTKDKNDVYFDDCEIKGHYSVVSGADPATFVASSTNVWTGEDKNHLYLDGEIVQ